MATETLNFSTSDGAAIKAALQLMASNASPLLHASVFIGSHPEMVRMRLSLRGHPPMSKLMKDPAVLASLQLDVQSEDLTPQIFLARTIKLWERTITEAAGKAEKLQGKGSAEAREQQAADLLAAARASLQHEA